jgi:hypothetical protein
MSRCLCSQKNLYIRLRRFFQAYKGFDGKTFIQSWYLFPDSIPKNRQVFVVGHSGSWCLPAATLLHAALVGLLGVVLSFLAVNEVKTLGLNLTVNEGTGKTSNDLLGLGVVINLACKRR